MKKIIIDLDGTITAGDCDDYKMVRPNKLLIEKLKDYKRNGYEVIISTARNMRTYDNNIGKININTLPSIIEWLNKHSVPYDEIYVGKQWCGFDGFYVDDKAIRPSEFTSLTYEEIKKLLEHECSVVREGDA